MKIIKSLVFSLFVLQNISLASEMVCSNKQFLTNLINSNASWKIVKDKKSKLTPIEKIIVDDKGSVWLETYKADPFPTLLGISTIDIEEKLLIGVPHYDISLPEYKELKHYEETQFILKPYRNDCTLKKILLEIIISDVPDNRQRENFVLEMMNEIK